MTAGEELLGGGNSNQVVRIGQTVRRRVPPNGAAVHRLLEHLAAVGFAASPRFLGLDQQGREILSYIEGAPGLHPFSAQVRSCAALAASVRLVREYHDATASMPTAGLHWPGTSMPGLPAEVVCHGDLAPYNLIFRATTPVGIIDFDNAAAGSRLEDLAYFAYRFAPLSAERNYHDGGWTPGVDRFGRLRRIVDGYGELDWSPLPDVVLTKLDHMITWIRSRAERGDPAVTVHLAEDHLGIYTADVAWIKANRVELATVIAG